MKPNQKYIIPFKGLKEGKYDFQYNIGAEFFESYEASDIRDARLQAEVALVKKPTHLEVEVKITGKVEIMCDRCLGYYYQEIENSGLIYVRFGEESGELAADLVILPLDETDLDVSQFIYDFSMLGLPMKRQHPVDENNNSLCDPEMLKILKSMNTKELNQDDPRWDKLKNINN